MNRTAYTLFTGGGGADIGLRAAGYALTGGVEYDARIAEVYARNMGHALTVADIRAVDPMLLPVAPPSWLHASPVCKNFSAAKTDGVEDEGDIAMADATVRFLDAWTPPTFSLEQVWAYRDSVSFGRITAALTRLGYSFDFWHLNAADYGVPQTRRRLILLAKRGAHYIQRPNPTHREGGDMFAPPWVGWYEAIEDLIPTLPPSQFAQWQLDRLPDLAETVLIDCKNTTPGFGGDRLRGRHEPAATLTTDTRPSHRPHAFIVDGSGNQMTYAEDGGSVTVPDGDAPMWTIRAAQHKAMPRAFILSNSKTEYGDGVRFDHEPVHSITTQADGRTRALLVSGDNASREPSRSDGSQPSFTIAANANKAPARAWLSRGRVVKMTLRALARFQSFPDWYEPQSTVEIGNAVPPLLMQRVAEAFS